MASIIDLPDGSFIAGDPPEKLDIGQHWCDWCSGSGLGYEYGYDDEMTLGICSGCFGACVRDCDDTACDVHSALHPRPSVDTF